MGYMIQVSTVRNNHVYNLNQDTSIYYFVDYGSAAREYNHMLDMHKQTYEEDEVTDFCTHMHLYAYMPIERNGEICNIITRLVEYSFISWDNCYTLEN